MSIPTGLDSKSMNDLALSLRSAAADVLQRSAQQRRAAAPAHAAPGRSLTAGAASPRDPNQNRVVSGGRVSGDHGVLVRFRKCSLLCRLLGSNASEPRSPVTGPSLKVHDRDIDFLLPSNDRGEQPPRANANQRSALLRSSAAFSIYGNNSMR